MEREVYQKRINDLLDGLESLLNANVKMGERIEKFLGDFQGTLMTDAYNAYAYFSQLDGCSHACCWAHVRRIYWSALKDYKDSLAQEFIELIGVLYKVELESILLHRTEAEVLC